MTTLIAVFNSDKCVGRCDAKCYDAEEPDCDCICGGRNHGAGQQQARENTRELGEKWIARCKANDPDITGVETPALQLEMITCV